MFLGEAHITNIAVLPHYRGQGYGEAVCRTLIQEAALVDIDKVTLEVRASNTTAQNLYLKLGFYSAGRRPGYYTDTNEDAVIMWKDSAAGSTAEPWEADKQVCGK